MDVPSVAQASAFQQAQFANQVSVAVAKKSLDSAKAQGEAVLSLLAAAVEVQQKSMPEPGKGARIDVHG